MPQARRGWAGPLLAHLVTVARRQGIRGFTAEVLRENKSMQAVLHAPACKVKSQLASNVCSFVLDVDQTHTVESGGSRRPSTQLSTLRPMEVSKTAPMVSPS
ncbi:MAG: hypothetical protein GY722_10065 [bacterium]|nr:hypothetical protein [bacterium]